MSGWAGFWLFCGLVISGSMIEQGLFAVANAIRYRSDLKAANDDPSG